MPEPRVNRRLFPDSPWLGLLPAAIAFVAMAMFSWRKWPDPIIDFGGQLYIPWQLSDGAVLYRDVMYLPGPVSQYYHALLFKLFGVSLTTILVSNLVILAGFVVLVYRLFLQCADRWVAAMVALSVTLGFAFSQFIDVGNYNYICPYSHEIWHAIVLATVMIGCVGNWLQRSRRKWLAATGICYGLIFLMKPENFVAATGIVVLGALLGRRQIKVSSLPIFVASVLIPLLGMFAVFYAREDFHQSILGVCGAWVPMLTSSMAGGAFFRAGMGLDVPAFHLKWMFLHFFICVAVVAYCAWRFRANRHRIELLVTGCVLAGLALNFDWTHCGRSLPLIVIAGLLPALHVWRTASVELRTRLSTVLLWNVFALLLLLKLGVYPRIVHYGVFLGMPAFVGAVVTVLWLVPMAFEKSIDLPRYRFVMTMIVTIGLVRLAIQSTLFYADKNVAIGDGGDRIIGYSQKISPVAEDVGRAVAWIKSNAPPQATIAALPEGALINYLSRHRNPTPYIVFMSEVYAFGEQRLTAPYYATPPDYILLVHRETGEYGLKFFGQQAGYGADMVRWIDRNYDVAQLIGSEPLRTGDFGIKIFKRKGNIPN